MANNATITQQQHDDFLLNTKISGGAILNPLKNGQ